MKFIKRLAINLGISRMLLYTMKCKLRKTAFQTGIFVYPDKLHIGCGDRHLVGFLNIDKRATKATDICMDCTNLNNLPTNHFSVIYANAFLEHLYKKDRLNFLKDVRRALKKEGKFMILSIPDFKTVASFYLKGKPGVLTNRFDLDEVYRHTHGDPEQFPTWWQEQLHKSLFDVNEVEKLLIDGGFHHFQIFKYYDVGVKVPVCLGFIAFKKKRAYTLSELKILIAQVTNHVNLNKISLIKER